jgi:hypothetical protein
VRIVSPGAGAVLSLGFAFACGDTSGSAESESAHGGSGVTAGAAGSSGAGAPGSNGGSNDGAGGLAASGGASGGGGAGDFVDQLMDSLGVVCREVRRCYPELQDDPAQCKGPVDEDRMGVWVDPFAALAREQLERTEACLRAYEDQAALHTWGVCVIAAEESEAECLAACPDSVESCLLTGNAALEECHELSPEGMPVEQCLRRN